MPDAGDAKHPDVHLTSGVTPAAILSPERVQVSYYDVYDAAVGRY